MLASGGDPQRELDVDSPAVKSLAADLFAEERRARLAAGIDELVVAARELPNTRRAALFLAAEVDLAWRLFALALVADELGSRRLRRPTERCSGRGIAALPVPADSVPEVRHVDRVTRGLCGTHRVLHGRRGGRRDRRAVRRCVAADRPERGRRPAGGQRQGRGAAHLQEGRPDQARPGVGRRRRGVADRRRAADRAEARLRRRLGQVLRQRRQGEVAADRLPEAQAERQAVPHLAHREDALGQVVVRAQLRDRLVRRLVPGVHRPRARLVRDRVRRAGRQPLGRAALAARAPELRPRRRTRPSRSGSSGSRTGRPTCRC